MKSKVQNAQENNSQKPNNKLIEQQPKEGEVEVDASGPGIASVKNSKVMVMVASSLLITVVLYFLFFRGSDSDKTEKLQDVPAPVVAGPPAKEENVEDFLADQKKDESVVLEKPAVPEVPKLPDLPKPTEGILPAFLPEEQKPDDVRMTEPPGLPVLPTNPTNINPAQPGSQLQTTNPSEPAPAAAAQDPRRSPIIVVAGDAGPGNSVGYENNIIALNQDPIDALGKTKINIIPTVVSDRTVVISQGKMLTAVLETAINTEMPGSVRAIVSRDVYADSGNNVLIPKGSRLYGSYSSVITRGQGRVEIDWTRLIRPDGVDVGIAFKAADQFGRSGIAGDVDNKYGSIVSNSLLTSVLAIGGAIAAEKLSGGGQVSTTVNAQQGSTTTVGKASSQAIYDVSKTIIDTVGQMVGNTMDIRPVIRVPQGTRVTIIVNGDMELPPVKKYNR
jgi:type IV secretion system protein VirB10